MFASSLHNLRKRLTLIGHTIVKLLWEGVEEEATTFVQRTAKEEHCPVLMYGPPGEVYIETNKLEEGTGRVLAEQLVQSLEKQQSKDTVRVIGSDSC